MSTRVQKGTEYRGPDFVRGDTFVLDLMFRVGDPNTGTPLDMAGDSWRLTLRHGKTDAVIAELTSAGGGILLNHTTTGRLYASVAHTATALWPVGSHKIDLERTPAAGPVRTYIRGIQPVTEDQSR